MSQIIYCTKHKTLDEYQCIVIFTFFLLMGRTGSVGLNFEKKALFSKKKTINLLDLRMIKKTENGFK